MLSEHFTLAAGRFATVLAEIVEVDTMFVAFLNLLSVFNKVADDLGELIEEAAAVGELTFDVFTAVGAFRFKFETGRDAVFAI
jgi:hypothetical protein